MVVLHLRRVYFGDEAMTPADLHARFRWLPRISPALVMRYTRMDWETCKGIVALINVMRDAEGLNRKKWARIK